MKAPSQRRRPHAAAPQAEAAAPSLWDRLLAPVDIASLVFFRIAFGCILLVEVFRFFLNGWVLGTFVVPRFHFTYYGFEWVQPLPGLAMVALFAALGVLALMILVGYRYRLATTLFFLGFTYVFLIDRSVYLNHFYLVSLVSFLMIFVPAGRRFSLDAWQRPASASDFAPAWTLWMLRFQIAIPYVYGGIAKLNGDWLYGQPMQMWMSRMTHLRAFLPAFGEPWLAMVFSYSGFLLDLFVVPLLLWKRTRPYAFAAAVAFHLMNATMWEIGIFPWFMICGTTLFFEPDWPRRLLSWLSPKFAQSSASQARLPMQRPPLDLRLKPVAVLVALYIAFQLLFPLRHLAYPGHVDWTEEGSSFAWRMMLCDKATAIQFVALDPQTGKPSEIDIRPYLSQHQLNRMSRDPDMIRQFAEFLATGIEQGAGNPIAVHALALCSLNGRKPQLLIDPKVDLGHTSSSLAPAPWIVPLREPLRDQAWEIRQEDWADLLPELTGN